MRCRSPPAPPAHGAQVGYFLWQASFSLLFYALPVYVVRGCGLALSLWCWPLLPDLTMLQFRLCLRLRRPLRYLRQHRQRLQYHRRYRYHHHHRPRLRPPLRRLFHRTGKAFNLFFTPAPASVVSA